MIGLNVDLTGIKASFLDVVSNKENKINRITRAAIPYFNFYGPFSQVTAPLNKFILMSENAQKSYRDLTDAWQMVKANPQSFSTYWRAGKGLTELATVVSAVACYPLSMALSTILELANQSQETGERIQSGAFSKQDAAVFVYKFSTHALRLGTLVCAGPEILVASIVMQIFLEIGQSYRQYQDKHYIEAISNLGLAVIRSYQIAPQTQALYQKWTRKETPHQQLKASVPPMPTQAQGIERRAAVDVGSGGTKVLIADVDTRTNEIVNVVFENSFSVPYQASLEKSPDGIFDSAIQEQGLKTFQQIKGLLDQHHVQKVSAIATEAFRKSGNGMDFAKDVQNLTQIPLRVISQQQEGIIAFNSALAVSKVNPDQVVVWDIGTGSFQMTSKNEEGGYDVFKEGLGSVPFKNYVIESVQGKDISSVQTPNPINEEEYTLTGRFARWLAKKASPDLKEKIKSPEVEVIGIGRLFQNSVLPLVSDSSQIDRKGLRTFIRSSLNHDDQELNNPYAHVDVPNCIQVLEVMKALHIQEVSVVNTTTTKGLMIGPEQDFSHWQGIEEAKASFV